MSQLTAEQQEALKKIKSLYGTPDGEDGVTLFIEHHLEEISADEWKELLNVETPTPAQILDALVLTSSWDSEDDGVIDTHDFSLPNEVTQYLISVHFVDGEIVSVNMES